MYEVNGICAIYSPFTIVFKIPYRALQASDFVSSHWSSESGPMWPHPMPRGRAVLRMLCPPEPRFSALQQPCRNRFGNGLLFRGCSWRLRDVGRMRAACTAEVNFFPRFLY